MFTEDLLLLATATVKSVKRCLTITELVVVWSVCSVCTSVTKSKVVGLHVQLDALQRFILFALAFARSRKTSVSTVVFGVVRRSQTQRDIAAALRWLAQRAWNQRVNVERIAHVIPFQIPVNIYDSTHDDVSADTVS